MGFPPNPSAIWVSQPLRITQSLRKMVVLIPPHHPIPLQTPPRPLFCRFLAFGHPFPMFGHTLSACIRLPKLIPDFLRSSQACSRALVVNDFGPATQALYGCPDRVVDASRNPRGAIPASALAVEISRSLTMCPGTFCVGQVMNV